MLAPDGAAPVAVLFAPGLDRDTVLARVAAAGANEIRSNSGWGGLLVARADDPAFAARLYAAGAWVVLRAPIGGLCRQP